MIASAHYKEIIAMHALPNLLFNIQVISRVWCQHDGEFGVLLPVFMANWPIPAEMMATSYRFKYAGSQ